MRESFLELDVALEHLSRVEHPTPELLWGTLRHFLADASGNPHRSELNIEKLDNPYLPGRGRQGLVEFRALAMARNLRVASARATLFRSIVALLSQADKVPTLTHWGDQLHDRFALPLFLARDLDSVFDDLRGADLALGHTVEQLLLEKEDAVLGVAEFEGCLLRLEQALEFWPLGLPLDLADAGRRRLERAVIEHAPTGATSQPLGAPSHALTEFCLDLRRLASPIGA